LSHFTCAVITDGTKTVEELMAPYQENNMETVPQEYLEFVDETGELMDEYESKSFIYYRNPDPYGTMSLMWQYDAVFKDERGDYNPPDGYAKVEVPRKLVFPTFERYMREFYDREPEEDGRYGYWENPNARWDWYTELESPCWADSVLGQTPTRLSGIRFNPTVGETDARDFIRAHPSGDKGIHDLRRYWAMHNMTDEQYVEAKRHLSFWACVTPDGKWHEVAEMLMFGVSEDVGGDAHYKWCVEFRGRFIDPYDGNYILHVLDCHI
jgi:hypothetical protein